MAGDPEDLLDRVQRKTKAAVEERLSAIEAEAKFAEEAVKREEAAGFWNEFVAEPLAEAGAEFLETFAGDPESVSEAKANLESLIHSFFDPATVLADLTSGVVPKDTISLDRFFGDVQFPASLIERTENYAGRKSTNSSRECQRGVIQATMATAGQVAAGAIGNAARALKSVQTSLAFVMDNLDDVGAALMQMPVQDLLAIVGSQDLVLSQIKSTVKSINDIIRDMDEEDYSFDHILTIRQEQSRLEGAKTKLSALEARLFAGASFNQALWDGAQADIKTSADVLCGIGIDELLFGLTLKPFKLLALVNYLETLCKILNRQQAQRDRLEGFLSEFQAQFEATAQFENLFLPIINQIQCRLTRIIEDMDSTVAKNQFFRFLLKEKQWCLELLAIYHAMKLSSKLNLPNNINKFTGTQAIQDAADAVVGFLRDAEFNIEQANAAGVIESCSVFSALVRRKMVRNIPSAPVVVEGEELIAEIELVQGQGGIFGGLLNVFDSSVATGAAAAITAVAGLLEFAEERNLTSFTEAIAEGNVTEAFGLDALTTSLEGQISSLAACIIDYTRGTGGNPLVEAEMLAVGEVFRDEARSLGLLDSLLHDYAGLHISARLGDETVDLKKLGDRIRRAGSALGVEVDLEDATFIDVREARKAKLRASAEGS